jgi:2-keto-4-pentenoate hydratase
MSDTKEIAAQHLVRARRTATPGPGLPESCLPMDLETALGVQQRVTELLGEHVGGWKCSLPKPDRIVAGPIYASTIFRASPCPLAATGAAARVEPEIAFVMGRALPPRATPYAESEVVEAIAEARLVLELLASRYSVPKSRSFPEMLADGLQNLGLFVGPAIAGTAYRDLPGTVPLKVEDRWGELGSREGKHPDGHPLAPLFWLANFLAARGDGLKPGDIVTTGSYAGVLEVPFGAPLRFTFGGLGELEVNFSRQ